MNLVLYGPPGSGKTTVGRIAARQLGRQFVDGDSWIEARWGRPVADYFSAGDEALFRSREAEAYHALASQDALVVAPGGGALSNPHSARGAEWNGWPRLSNGKLKYPGGPPRARPHRAAIAGRRPAWQVGGLAARARAALSLIPHPGAHGRAGARPGGSRSRQSL